MMLATSHSRDSENVYWPATSMAIVWGREYPLALLTSVLLVLWRHEGAKKNARRTTTFPSVGSGGWTDAEGWELLVGHSNLPILAPATL